MPVYIIALMLCAALLHATWNAIVKSGSNKLYESALNCFGGGLTVLFLLPFIPLPAVESLPMLAGSCLTHIAYYLCLTNAYRSVDMSYAYTIMRGTAPLLTSLFLLCTGVPLSAGGMLGVFCLCGGVLVLTLDHVRQGHFSVRGTLAAFMTAAVIMTYTLFDGYGARASGAPISYTVWLYIVNIVPLNLFLLLRERKSYLSYCRDRWKIGIFGGACGFGSYGVALWAMTKAPIAMVAALRETSVIFGMILAVLFLGERFTLTKLVAVVLVAASTMLMKLS
ncbi:MAG: EamA family transporter [Mailhella sp.]|nr:EamA family transporter [Mailhella sp.]